MSEAILHHFFEELGGNGDLESAEMEVADNIAELLDFPDFYKIPIPNAIQIFKKSEYTLNETQTKNILDKFMKNSGIDALQLVPFLNFELGSIVQSKRNFTRNKSQPFFGYIKQADDDLIRKKGQTENEFIKPTPEIPKRKKKVTRIKVPHYMQNPKQSPLSESKFQKYSSSSPNLLLKVTSPTSSEIERSPRRNLRHSSKDIPRPYSWRKSAKEIAKEERESKLIALFAAVDREELNTIEKILKEDKSFINVKTSQEETLLHIAMRKENLNMASLLLRYGAEVDALNKFGSTPLYNAIYQGDITGIEFLIGAGANIEFRNYKGNTPLHWAVDCQKPRVCSFLISKGVNINAQNNEGETPLFMACDQNLYEIFKILFDAGADINIPNRFNEVPLDIVDHPDILDLLKSKSN